MPSVAENESQNPASKIAPGENKTIRNPANERAVKESDTPDTRNAIYTIKSIITDLVAETENPVSIR